MAGERFQELDETIRSLQPHINIDRMLDAEYQLQLCNDEADYLYRDSVLSPRRDSISYEALRYRPTDSEEGYRVARKFRRERMGIFKSAHEARVSLLHQFDSEITKEINARDAAIKQKENEKKEQEKRVGNDAIVAAIVNEIKKLQQEKATLIKLRDEKTKELEEKLHAFVEEEIQAGLTSNSIRAAQEGEILLGETRGESVLGKTKDGDTVVAVINCSRFMSSSRLISLTKKTSIDEKGNRSAKYFIANYVLQGDRPFLSKRISAKESERIDILGALQDDILEDGGDNYSFSREVFHSPDQHCQRVIEFQKGTEVRLREQMQLGENGRALMVSIDDDLQYFEEMTSRSTRLTKLLRKAVDQRDGNKDVYGRLLGREVIGSLNQDDGLDISESVAKTALATHNLTLSARQVMIDALEAVAVDDIDEIVGSLEQLQKAQKQARELQVNAHRDVERLLGAPNMTLHERKALGLLDVEIRHTDVALTRLDRTIARFQREFNQNTYAEDYTNVAEMAALVVAGDEKLKATLVALSGQPAGTLLNNEADVIRILNMILPARLAEVRSALTEARDRAMQAALGYRADGVAEFSPAEIDALANILTDKWHAEAVGIALLVFNHDEHLAEARRQLNTPAERDAALRDAYQYDAVATLAAINHIKALTTLAPAVRAHEATIQALAEILVDRSAMPKDEAITKLRDPAQTVSALALAFQFAPVRTRDVLQQAHAVIKSAGANPRDLAEMLLMLEPRDIEAVVAVDRATAAKELALRHSGDDPESVRYRKNAEEVVRHDDATLTAARNILASQADTVGTGGALIVSTATYQANAEAVVRHDDATLTAAKNILASQADIADVANVATLQKNAEAVIKHNRATLDIAVNMLAQDRHQASVCAMMVDNEVAQRIASQLINADRDSVVLLLGDSHSNTAEICQRKIMDLLQDDPAAVLNRLDLNIRQAIIGAILRIPGAFARVTDVALRQAIIKEVLNVPDAFARVTDAALRQAIIKEVLNVPGAFARVTDVKLRQAILAHVLAVPVAFNAVTDINIRCAIMTTIVATHQNDPRVRVMLQKAFHRANPVSIAANTTIDAIASLVAKNDAACDALVEILMVRGTVVGRDAILLDPIRYLREAFDFNAVATLMAMKTAYADFAPAFERMIERDAKPRQIAEDILDHCLTSDIAFDSAQGKLTRYYNNRTPENREEALEELIELLKDETKKASVLNALQHDLVIMNPAYVSDLLKSDPTLRAILSVSAQHGKTTAAQSAHEIPKPASAMSVDEAKKNRAEAVERVNLPAIVITRKLAVDTLSAVVARGYAVDADADAIAAANAVIVNIDPVRLVAMMKSLDAARKRALALTLSSVVPDGVTINDVLMQLEDPQYVTDILGKAVANSNPNRASAYAVFRTMLPQIHAAINREADPVKKLKVTQSAHDAVVTPLLKEKIAALSPQDYFELARVAAKTNDLIAERIIKRIPAPRANERDLLDALVELLPLDQREANRVKLRGAERANYVAVILDGAMGRHPKEARILIDRLLNRVSFAELVNNGGFRTDVDPLMNLTTNSLIAVDSHPDVVEAKLAFALRQPAVKAAEKTLRQAEQNAMQEIQQQTVLNKAEIQSVAVNAMKVNATRANIATIIMGHSALRSMFGRYLPIIDTAADARAIATILAKATPEMIGRIFNDADIIAYLTPLLEGFPALATLKTRMEKTAPTLRNENIAVESHQLVITAKRDFEEECRRVCVADQDPNVDEDADVIRVRRACFETAEKINRRDMLRDYFLGIRAGNFSDALDPGKTARLTLSTGEVIDYGVEEVLQALQDQLSEYSRDFVDIQTKKDRLKDYADNCLQHTGRSVAARSNVRGWLNQATRHLQASRFWYHLERMPDNPAAIPDKDVIFVELVQIGDQYNIRYAVQSEAGVRVTGIVTNDQIEGGPIPVTFAALQERMGDILNVTNSRGDTKITAQVKVENADRLIRIMNEEPLKRLLSAESLADAKAEIDRFKTEKKNADVALGVAEKLARDGLVNARANAYARLAADPAGMIELTINQLQDAKRASPQLQYIIGKPDGFAVFKEMLGKDIKLFAEVIKGDSSLCEAIIANIPGIKDHLSDFADPSMVEQLVALIRTNESIRSRLCSAISKNVKLCKKFATNPAFISAHSSIKRLIDDYPEVRRLASIERKRQEVQQHILEHAAPQAVADARGLVQRAILDKSLADFQDITIDDAARAALVNVIISNDEARDIYERNGGDPRHNAAAVATYFQANPAQAAELLRLLIISDLPSEAAGNVIRNLLANSPAILDVAPKVKKAIKDYFTTARLDGYPEVQAEFEKTIAADAQVVARTREQASAQEKIEAAQRQVDAVADLQREVAKERVDVKGKAHALDMTTEIAEHNRQLKTLMQRGKAAVLQYGARNSDYFDDGADHRAARAVAPHR